ncbi:protein kinase [Nonomuraea sp. NPDC050556]|uniref:protein kinase domain-containing protein n=1 Tax=Nonomuraea sp. NPDC050556 TaxID=3364369 RepID=UPI0037966BA9
MPSIAELRAGDPAHLAGYELRGRLGEGGQGVVYLGADASGGLVAIKWLRPHLAGDAVAAERFAREAAVATRVAPFCTARMLATGVHDERPYIVSEYVEGPSLQQVVLNEGPFTAAKLHRLAIGTITALAAIHQAGIVHRDFSPNNVLLANEGPRVIDFGISRALDATTTITSAPVGTPAYMAPEQVLGHQVGPPADLFSWASIVVFAATGNGPFAAESVPAVINRVMNSEPDLSALHGPLRDTVAACLSKDPARRPTAEQVIMRLLQHPEVREAAPPTTPYPPRQPYPQVPPQPVHHQQPVYQQPQPIYQQQQQPVWAPPAPRKSGSKGFVIAGIAAAVAVIATISVVVVALANRPTTTITTTSGTVTPKPTTTKLAGKAVPTTGLSSVKLPDTDVTIYENPADAVKLTTYTVWNAKLKAWVYYTRDSLNGAFKKYANHWESMLSPDGRYLVKRGKKFTGDGYDSVEITDKVTSETFTVKTSRQPLSAYISAWSRDSRRVLLNVGNPTDDGWQSTGFAIVDVAAKQSTVSSLREGSLRDIHYGFSDDGAGVVAVSSTTKQQAIRLFDKDGTRLRRIPNVGSGLAGFFFSPSGDRFLTNCPGLGKNTHCIYDSQTGNELRRFESSCSGGSTWYDEQHLVCWVRPEEGGDRQQIQVIDFAGQKVRLLADVPVNGENLEVYYTFTGRG